MKPNPQQIVQEIAKRYAMRGGDVVVSPASIFLHGVAIGAMGAACVDVGALLETVLKLQREAAAARRFVAAMQGPKSGGSESRTEGQPE